MAMRVLHQVAAAVSEMLAMGNQLLMQMAGEQRDGLRHWVTPEEVAGHADLPAAAGTQYGLIWCCRISHIGSVQRPIVGKLLKGDSCIQQ
jgi:hypothetical protein